MQKAAVMGPLSASPPWVIPQMVVGNYLLYTIMLHSRSEETFGSIAFSWPAR